jgi:hypothetical protein
VAGVAGPPGGADVGYLDLLCHPLVGLGPLLPELVAGINVAAAAYAVAHLIAMPWGVPPFVGLSFPHRTAVVTGLFERGRPDRFVWVLLALLVSAAFDSAAARHTTEAVRNRHAGLTFLGFPAPGPDGRWRFGDFSYGRRLAAPHPATSTTGSPP